ncbi:MAG: peptidoglycan-binding protein LysM [Acidobacteriota bacterium]
MGFFDFLKDAGKKIAKPEPEAKPMAREYSPAEVKALNEKRRAKGLAREVDRLGLEVDELAIEVDGDVVTVRGSVNVQETKEKVVLALGNTSGVARVDDQLSVEVEEPEAQFHTVERGDTLSAIAKKYYGDAMKYPVIFEANKPMLSDPDKIYPGQVLRIPAAD